MEKAKAKVVVVVLADDVHPSVASELVGAFALFRGVKGVARAEDGGVFEVDVPSEPHEPLWEAFRRLDVKFEERPES